jgi:hypothetical protein
LNDDVDVFSEAQISVRADCQSSGYEIPNASRCKCGGKSFKAGEFHGVSACSLLSYQKGSWQNT